MPLYMNNLDTNTTEGYNSNQLPPDCDITCISSLEELCSVEVQHVIYLQNQVQFI